MIFDRDQSTSSSSSYFGKSGNQRRYTSEMLFQPFYGLSRYAKFLFILYIAVSLIYTLAHFYALFHGVYQPPVLLHERTVVGKIVLDNGNTHTSAESNGLDTGSSSFWTGRFSVFTQEENQKGSAKDIFDHVSKEALFSKMFQYALKPSKIIPYFMQMQHAPEKTEITITTLITIERLHVFNNLVNHYKGPISVTLHIADDEHKQEALEQLHDVQTSNPLFAKFVDVHLVVDNFDRQFNLWRNIARFFSRTDLVMATDVDFLLCSDLKENVSNLPKEHWERLLNGSVVFVIPAFEFGRDSAELDIADYPSTKEELQYHVNSNGLMMFHNKWKRGHGPTNYPRWYQATEPYKVVDYNYNYEPYVVMRRDNLPWCDERFVGYGSNKAACLYEIYLSGAEFWVLPYDFLIHQRHPYPENDRRVERKYNKRLFDAFREETCFRYGRMSAGVPNTSAVDERICGSNFPSYYGL